LAFEKLIAKSQYQCLCLEWRADADGSFVDGELAGGQSCGANPVDALRYE